MSDSDENEQLTPHNVTFLFNWFLKDINLIKDSYHLNYQMAIARKEDSIIFFCSHNLNL